MFLRAGALSLALLLASRLLGVARESSIAAAFGSSGLADVAVLALSLPDWIASVAAGGAMAYVLLPAWAGQPPGVIAAQQARLARSLLLGGAVLALALAFTDQLVVEALAGGVPATMRPLAGQALWWSAAAVPAALLAALWATRAQHERDFTGLHGANLVVNAALIVAVAIAAFSGSTPAAILVLGLGLLAAMGLRLAWLLRRQPRSADMPAADAPALAPNPWLWPLLVAGLPLALPFAARSAASHAGEGALATFNYAWKLVELPLVLAIQLVASLAFPAVARAMAGGKGEAQVRQAFALAWSLACAALAALAVGAPAFARLLFGWGRMDAAALESVWRWAQAGSWSLLPQAVIAVALTVLAARRRLAWPVAAYALVLGALLAAAMAGVADGSVLMHLLNGGYTLVAIACLAALAHQRAAWLPWPAIASSTAALLLVLAVLALLPEPWREADGWLAAAGAVLAAMLVMLGAFRGSADLREGLRR